MRALLLWITAATGGFAAGLDAYRQGRFPEAQAAFAAEVERRGDAAPAELLCNLALAALRAGDVRAAEDAARRARARATGETAAFAAFLEGNVAFARCEFAAAAAEQPEAEPFAYDLAMLHARQAAEAWLAALVERAEWPAARRNVERTLRKLEELQRRKAERAAEEERKKEQVPEDPAPEEPERLEERALEALEAELSPEDVARLFERLKAEEEEKREVRREQRRSGSRQVERDW